MMNEITADVIKADRAARKLSRVKYAALLGLTQTRVFNLEKGSKPTEEEEVKLHDLINSGVPVATKVQPPPTFPPAPEDDGVILVDELDSDENDDALGVGDEVQGTLFDDTASDQTSAETKTYVGLPTKYAFKYPGYHISNSEIQTFKRCKRKWWLAYYRELKLKSPDVTGPRALGTRIHLALSAFYSIAHEDPMEVLESTITFDRKILSEGTDVDALLDLEKEADLARAMLEGYLQWVEENGADEGLEIIGNEEVVEVPFGTFLGVVVVLVGKMDIRIRRIIDHARLFLDHKTVPNFTTPTKTLHLDEQMLYYHLLEYLSFLADGVPANEVEYAAGGIYNMLRKVKRTATATPPFYSRVEVRHNIHELRSFYIRVFGEVTAIMELRAALDGGANPQQVAFPTPKGDCSWDCDFIAVCPMFDDGSAAEELLTSYYEQGDPHDHYYPMGEREDERSGA